MSELRWQPIRCAISLSFKLSTVRKASCYVCIFGIKKNFVHDLKAFVYYFPDQFILILEYFFYQWIYPLWMFLIWHRIKSIYFYFSYFKKFSPLADLGLGALASRHMFSLLFKCSEKNWPKIRLVRPRRNKAGKLYLRN